MVRQLSIIQISQDREGYFARCCFGLGSLIGPREEGCCNADQSENDQCGEADQTRVDVELFDELVHDAK